MSITDTICAKTWKFNGSLVRPEDNSRDKAYPAIGLVCEATRVETPASASVPIQTYYSWVPEPAPDGTITTYQTEPTKALRLKMLEPAIYQHQLRQKHPGKFPVQGPMSTQFKDRFEKLIFVENGSRLLSNSMTVEDPDIKGGERLEVGFEIYLLPFRNGYSMIITGIWSDSYTGTGGWC